MGVVVQPGDTIGAYRIERELGRGGMGVVLLATDTALDRAVAIKSLPEGLAGDADRLARFEREARTLAQLHHPNIAGIFGVEERGGARYLVLEYVEGETLADRLDRGPMPLADAIEVAEQVALGVEAAHEAGVIHRDLKPGNIMLTPDGAVKVLDFGLARTEEIGSSGVPLDAETVTTPAGHQPTAPGVVLGTAPYMSPEQARGRRVDRRTDIWSLGVILYEMLTGVCPFVGETATDSIGAVLHKAVDLGALPAGTPAGVRRVLSRCVERDKNLRFRDVGDVRIELLSAVAEEEAGGTSAGRGGSAGWVVAAVLAIALALSASALAVRWGGINPDSGAPRVVHSTLRAPAGLEFIYVEFSGDGDRIAGVMRPVNPIEQRPDLQLTYVRDLSDDGWRPVAGSERSFQVKFSPDGERLAILCSLESSSEAQSLRIAPSDGSSAAVPMFRVDPSYRVSGGASWMTWTPSGQIAMVSQTDVRLDLIEVGTGRVASSVPITGPRAPSISGLGDIFDERHITLRTMRYSDRGYHEDVGLVDVVTGVFSPLLDDARSVRRLTETSIAFARGEDILVADFDPSTMRVTGQFRIVEDNGWRRALWAHTSLLTSNRGDMLYSEGGTQGNDRVIRLTASDGTERDWGDPGAYEDEVAISPNGQRIAVTRSLSGGTYEVWGSEVDRPRLRRLIRVSGSDVSSPRFLPDNERLIVTRQSGRNDDLDFLLVRFDGNGEPVSLLGDRAIGPDKTWAEVSSVSPDNEWAWITSYEAGRYRSERLALDGSGRVERPFGEFSAWTVQESPDGSGLLAYRSDEGGQRGVYVRLFRDGRLLPAIPLTSERLWGFGWRYDAAGDLVLVCVRPGGLKFFQIPVSVEDGVGAVPRIVIGDPLDLDQTTHPDALTGDFAIGAGMDVTIHKGPNEIPITEITLIQGWRDRVLGEGTR